MVRYSHTERSERAAFPEYYPDNQPAPAAQYALWAYQDRCRQIDTAAAAISKNPCSRTAEERHAIASLQGMRPAQARAVAAEIYQKAKH